jgi:lipoic acid synthetase
MAVAEFVTPAAFAAYEEAARAMGFLYVASGAMVRSSYRAGELYLKNMLSGGGSSEAAAAAAGGGGGAEAAAVGA